MQFKDYFVYCNACTVHLYIVFITANESTHTHTHIYIYIYITIFSLYRMLTPTCFDTSVSSFGSFKTRTSLSYMSSKIKILIIAIPLTY